MPRIPRGQVAGHAYHILNRGNGGAAVFHKDGDYTAFVGLPATAKAKYPVKVFGFCLMPNHFHLVVQPATDAPLCPFMQWWMTSHLRRYHRHYRSHGQVWQGRFKSFPIQQDAHLLTVLRYVLRNPVRAGLAEHAMDWPWSSLRFQHLSDSAPVEAPTEWLPWIDQPLVDHELTALRTCVNRQQPFGTADWQAVIATTLGLESTLRYRGRPRTPPENSLSTFPPLVHCKHEPNLAVESRMSSNRVVPDPRLTNSSNRRLVGAWFSIGIVGNWKGSEYDQ